MDGRVLGQRIGYGALAILGLCALFIADVEIARRGVRLGGALGDLLERGSVLPLVNVVVYLFGAVELDRLLRIKGARPHTGIACVMVSALLLTPWLSSAGWLGEAAAQVHGFLGLVTALLIAVFVSGVSIMLRRDAAGALRDMGATWFIIIYLGFLGSFALQLRCARDMPEQSGAWLLLMVVLVTKVSDIGAFFVGSALGRHKLIPAISPAKSIEGTIGGLAASAMVASALTAMAFAAAGTAPASVGTSDAPSLSNGLSLSTAIPFLTSRFPHGPPLFQAAVLGMLLSAAGQFGDLVESCFKRDAEVKDSGNVIPRFGGILDLIDSLVLAIPVGWFLLTVIGQS